MPIENTNLNISSIKRIARGRLSGQWKTAFIPAFIITLLTGIPALFAAVSRSIIWVNLMADDSWMNASDPTEIINAMNSVQLSGPVSVLNSLLSLFSFLCGGALSVSLAALALKIIRREEYSSSTAFAGFSQFVRAFIISLLIMVFTFLWAMVTILPATVVFSVGLAMESTAMAVLGTIILITAFVGYILIILRYSMSYFIASDDQFIPASHVTTSSVFLMRRRTGNFFLLELSFIGWLLLASIPLAIGISMINAGYAAGLSGLILIGVILSAASMVPLAFVSLYVTTSEAVYYSTITGNYNVNNTAGGAGQGRPDNPAEPDSVLPESPILTESTVLPESTVQPESAAHEYFPDSLSSDNPYDPDTAPPSDSDPV